MPENSSKNRSPADFRSSGDQRFFSSSRCHQRWDRILAVSRFFREEGKMSLANTALLLFFVRMKCTVTVTLHLHYSEQHCVAMLFISRWEHIESNGPAGQRWTKEEEEMHDIYWWNIFRASHWQLFETKCLKLFINLKNVIKIVKLLSCLFCVTV